MGLYKEKVQLNVHLALGGGGLRGVLGVQRGLERFTGVSRVWGLT